MGVFDHFPYTNFHELNLEWILLALQEIQQTMKDFVSLNAIKYADPIQWDITRQYEKNTIVIDPLTGTAYISVRPVPSGANITDTDYWTVVFDLGQFVVKMAQNLAHVYEPETTLTATVASNYNDWIIWGDILYRNINPAGIIPGDQYVVGSNIEQFNMEDIIGHVQDLNTTDKSNLVAAINEVLQTLADTTGDLNDLNTTDKSNLVAAINEVLQTLADTTGDLNDLNTTDKSNLVAAINDVLVITGNIIGDLNDLNTTDKSNLVAAINDVLVITGNIIGDLNNLQTPDKSSVVNSINSMITLMDDRKVLHSRDFGAVGDGVTDDTAALQNWLDAADRDVVLILDGGEYHTTQPLNVRANSFITGIELGSATFIDQFAGGTLNIAGDIVWLSLIDFGAHAGASGICIKGVDNHALNIYKCQLGGQSYGGASQVTFLDESGAFYNIILDNCLVDGGGATGYALSFIESQSAIPTDIIIRNCFLDNYLATTGGVVYYQDVTDSWIVNSIMRSSNTILNITSVSLQPTYSFNWLIQCSVDCLTAGANIFNIDPFCALYTNSYIVDRGATVMNRGVYSLYDDANSVQLPMMGRNIFVPESPMTETFSANTGRQVLWFTSTPGQFLMRSAWATFTTQFCRIKLDAIAQTLGFSYGIGLKNIAGEILWMRYDFYLKHLYLELYDPGGVISATLFSDDFLFDGHYFAITKVAPQQFVFSVSNNGSDYYDLGQFAFEDDPKLGVVAVNMGTNTVNPNKIVMESSYLY